MRIKQKLFFVFLVLMTAGLSSIAANSSFTGMVRDYAAVRTQTMDMPVHEQTLDAFSAVSEKLKAGAYQDKVLNPVLS